ncbi:MAG: DUF6398 domain-containing protein [Actinomycetia bacterium]|nr:DUF6398 domain-containing protein [Actinomycetes bacterium]
MAKKRGPRRPPNRSATRRGERPSPHQSVANTPHVAELRELLRLDDPVMFGIHVLTILGLTRVTEEMDLGEPEGDEPPTTVTGLVEAFSAADVAETTAALHVIAGVIEDELMAARIRRVLAERRQPVHPKLASFAEVEVIEAYLVPSDDASGDDILLIVRWPDGSTQTLAVVLDNTIGGAVVDFMVTLGSHEDSLEFIREDLAEEGIEVEPISLADAAATLDVAVDIWVEVQPPGDSDGWPEAMSFLMLLLSGMPDGGVDRSRVQEWEERVQEWEESDWDDDDELETSLAHAFLASEYGPDAVDESAHDIAHVIAQVATVFFVEPRRWDVANVETALRSGLPLLLEDEHDDEEVLDLLRGYLRFSADKSRTGPEELAEVLAAVDTFTDVFVEARRSSEVAAARAVLAQRREQASLPWAERRLLAQVGSVEALDALDDAPLPEEILDLTSVPKDIHRRVQDTADLIDRGVDELIGTVEFRTACLRLLAHAARESPEIFRRRSRDETAAAAIVWIIGRANRIFETCTVAEVMAQFGVTGSPSQRAQAFYDALGVDYFDRTDGTILGTPDLLLSTTRRDLIRRRDHIRTLENGAN